ncbi:putative phosphatidate cytidylyltransferase [Aspergillus candidus]|uniref:dolichol kinase n=1 Tax=Aspergillus candidus TaxID=41067 RepID=A0A2I2FGU3_ASPCN|nr:phosphatidate cytidylyltransferase [Aspergillus candidus]PLB39851.1 phosphatidate cytidylyltransferase [Aspergillus candidus]
MASSQSQEEERSRHSPDPGLTVPDPLRRLSRSPHPYHRQGGQCLDPQPTDRRTSLYTSKTSSDSGTEADDESTGLLRGLPAPPLRPRKGLRAVGDYPHDSWLPVLTRSTSRSSRSSRRSSSEEAELEACELREKESRKRRLEILRRLLETALLLSVGAVVLRPESVRAVAWAWRKELLAYVLTVVGLYAAYPLRRGGRLRLSKLSSFAIPSSFDPAPLLYPVILPVYVALSLSHRDLPLVLPNILLSLASLPTPVVPLHEWFHGGSVAHWMVTLAPVLVSEQWSADHTTPTPLSLRGLSAEQLTLLFPLHQALIPTLDFLLTTSVLPAELQLLTAALINLFLYAASPQAEILKALLWLGGLCLLVSCRQVLRWEVALARIPTWKFRRAPSGAQSPKGLLNAIDHRLCQRLSRAGSSEDPMSDSDSLEGRKLVPRRTMHDYRTKTRAPEPLVHNGVANGATPKRPRVTSRRHTIASVDDARVRTTPSGRRKRSMAPGLASFLALTVPQAQVRRWLYALYAYAAAVVTIMGPVRRYVGQRALSGAEPFGWAIGYLFGNISGVRFWTLMWNLDHWVALPARPDLDGSTCALGWVERLRQTTFGEANTRLLIAAYCVVVILAGLAVVLQLSAVAEVDTRRKVFHGMMVLMFLPTVYIDPAFCALALALVLTVFLLLDLFRASQLPPISRPLTYFLAPYVDGRDHRGPVIVSHIFLLIGCSIPLWLSLADLPRTGDLPWSGWEVVSRDVSMVSGIVCVGMGDAAASLVGRRIGRLKWFWGGGKSLEGSLAFAAAVTVGLLAARAWLAVGDWSVSGAETSTVCWPIAVLQAVLAAGGTSATEAILTGCNDNVVVPIVLWLLVRGLGL